MHVDCLNQAVRRIYQGEVESEYELQPLHVESYPAYRYSLHLPAPDEICPFCSSRAKLTDEHTASTMRPMLRGHETILNAVSQRLLSLWAAKTAFLIERRITQLVPRGFVMELATVRRPSDAAFVYLGAYTGGSMAAFGSSRPFFMDDSEEPKAVLVTFSAFKVVFQVFFYLTAGGVSGHTPEFGNDSFLPRIWPVAQPEMTWPPPSLLDDQLIRDIPGRVEVTGARTGSGPSQPSC